MSRIAFKMQLHPGCETEYQRRHDTIWPELSELLHETGIRDYSIFLDASTLTLFGVLTIDHALALEALPQQPVMQRWWAYMADIMQSHPNNEPVSIPLQEVFYMP